jgi:hypothetical protein
MSTFLLITVLIGSAWIQHAIDARTIASMAEELHWSVSSLRWAPLARFFTSRKGDRWYRLAFVDEKGRRGTRLCRVRGWLGFGTSIEFGPGTLDLPSYDDAHGSSSTPAQRVPSSGMSRIAFVILCAFGGAWAASALGIGICMLIFPGSNIAPAYGILFGAPIGGVAGVLFGVFRRR